MPTYDYRCNACGHTFELFQSMKDKPKRTCPECGKPKLERLIGTGAAVVFKGSGFYQTDYRSESYKKAAEADKPASDTKTESKPETKAATKPETKSESKSDAKPAKPEAKSERGPKADAKPRKGAGSK